jgi:hypothetical protein
MRTLLLMIAAVGLAYADPVPTGVDGRPDAFSAFYIRSVTAYNHRDHP